MRDMETSWGEFLNWGASILAGLIIVLALVNYFYNASEGVPAIPVVALAVAGVIWLTGRFCRAVFGGR